jgi:hypothetical protein
MANFIDDVFDSLVFLITRFTSLLVFIIPIFLALFLSGGVTEDELDVNPSHPDRNERADNIGCAEWAAKVGGHDPFAEATLWKC